MTCDSNSCDISEACVANNRTLFVIGSASVPIVERALLSVRLRRNGSVALNVRALDISILTTSRRRSKAFLIERYVDNNCGHILGDEVWPAFRMMQKYAPNSDRLGHESDLYVDRPSRPRCDDYFDALVKNGEVFDLNLKTEVESRIICYDHVYFGMSGFSYVDEDLAYLSSPVFSADAKAFRNKFYMKYPSKEKENPDKLVIMEKRSGDHLTNIDNINELKLAAARTFKELDVLIACLEDYSVGNQVELMSRTKMLISLPGSDVMNAIFMQDDSTLLVYCRFVNGVKENSNEIRLWFRYLVHLRVFEFCSEFPDVRLEDNRNVWINVTRLNDTKYEQRLIPHGR
eukprot:29852-Pelagococcus_subviridis.AAC.2